ncbi:hypothetical protein [Streptomyces sp. G-G2]|uniref:hypothetical protein n=1 Tax=Streptomyces sp. G-G2 TaxID=3046201 RepID=UPI0024BAA444|nr:hypothetical protein [Streptomyces sp. G-G2]MDJ0382100.1 hypothetical protein [Streptomyces sp. G-G2]
MKRITRGLSLVCTTAAVLVPLAGTAAAAPAGARVRLDDGNEQGGCAHEYGNHENWHHGHHGGVLGIGLGLGALL